MWFAWSKSWLMYRGCSFVVLILVMHLQARRLSGQKAG